MKRVKLYEDFIAEANKGKVHRAAKKGSYPAVIVVVQDGKVIHQEPVSTPDIAPATFNVMQEKYPKALIHLEDNTGKRLFSESVVTEAKNTIGLAFKSEDDYNGFVEFIEDEGGKIFKNIGWDHKTKSWEVIMDTSVLDDIYGEGHPGNKESGWYGALPTDFESVIIESVVTENIRIGKVLAIKKYNAKTNRKEVVDVRVTDYIKKPGSKDFVEYDLKGKKRKVSINVFQSMIAEGKFNVTEGVLCEATVEMDESVVTEANIKYKKGKTYQSEGPWTVVVDSNSSGLDISVNNSAGWRLDPQDEREETFQLLDAGRQRATLTFKEGNIDAFAKKMFDLNDRTTHGEKEGLTAKDYADIIRVWIDMRMANESIVNEASQEAYTLHRLADNPGEAVADEFLSKHNVDFKLLTKAIQQGTINKYELRDIVNGSAQSSKMKKFIKDFVTESILTESEAPSALLKFMEDEIADGTDATVHLATFDGSSMEAQSTKKTWDDGVPVTKNFSRGGYKSVSPKGKIWILESEQFWYFETKGTWYAVKIADYGTSPFEY